MTEKVKGILLREETLEALLALSDEQRGKLILALFADSGMCEKPELDSMTNMAFVCIVPGVRRAQEDSYRRYNANVENGKKGGRPRKYPIQETEEKTDGLFEKPMGFEIETQKPKPNQTKPIKLNTPYIPHSSEPISLMETSSASPAECVSISGKKNASSDGRHGYSDDFETFWLAYPRKVNKGAAWKAWQKLGKEKVLPDVDTLRECLSWRKVAEDWERDGGKYIPHPATWLNARGWEDDACREQVDPRNDPREEEAYRIAQTMGGFNPLREEHQNQRAYWERMVRINTALEETGLGEFGTPKDLIASRLEEEA